MHKRVLVCLIVAAMLVSLVACNKRDDAINSTDAIAPIEIDTDAVKNQGSIPETIIIKKIKVDENNYAEYFDISCSWKISENVGPRPILIITPKTDANIIGVNFPYNFKCKVYCTSLSGQRMGCDGDCKVFGGSRKGYYFYESDAISIDEDGYATVSRYKFYDENLTNEWYLTSMFNADTKIAPTFDQFYILSCEVYVTK